MNKFFDHFFRDIQLHLKIKQKSKINSTLFTEIHIFFFGQSKEEKRFSHQFFFNEGFLELNEKGFYKKTQKKLKYIKVEFQEYDNFYREANAVLFKVDIIKNRTKNLKVRKELPVHLKIINDNLIELHFLNREDSEEKWVQNIKQMRFSETEKNSRIAADSTENTKDLTIIEKKTVTDSKIIEEIKEAAIIMKPKYYPYL